MSLYGCCPAFNCVTGAGTQTGSVNSTVTQWSSGLGTRSLCNEHLLCQATENMSVATSVFVCFDDSSVAYSLWYTE